MTLMVIIDRHAKNLRGFTADQARNADIIVGRDRTVLKDREGQAGVKLSEKALAELREEATELIDR